MREDEGFTVRYTRDELNKAVKQWNYSNGLHYDNDLQLYSEVPYAF